MAETFEIKGEKELSNLTCDLLNDNYYFDSYGRQMVSRIDDKSMVIGSGDAGGLKWKWICTNDTSTMSPTSPKTFSTYIQLIWDQKSMNNAEGFKGNVQFTLTRPKFPEIVKNVPFEVGYSGEWFGERNVKVLDVEEPPEQARNRRRNRDLYRIKFELTCTPTHREAEETKSSEVPKNELLDGALMIEEQVVYVNKKFLSYHSEYFERMFFSSFRERELDVVTIREVSLDDFYGLMSLMLPEPGEPPVEKISHYLELADMFLMPGVTRQLETFLEASDSVKDSQKILLADKHGLEKLLRSILISIDHLEELKALTRRPEFSGLGNDSKAMFLERFLHFL